MKIKNWIEMRIGLAMGKRQTTNNDLFYIRKVASANGVDEAEIDVLIEKHLVWCREQGYQVALK